MAKRYIGKQPDNSAKAQLNKPKRHNARAGSANNADATMAPVTTTGGK